MRSTGQPNKTLNEPNRQRSASDSAIQIECSLRRHQLPDWALPRSDYDVASCSSDDDHERIEIDDRNGYCCARRKKLKVRRRWKRTIGPDAYEIPSFCEVLTEHVRSVKDGPLDADGIEEHEGFLATLTAPYEPPPTSRDPKIDWTKYSPSPLPTPRRNQGDPKALRNCAAEQDVDNDRESDDDEPSPHLDGDYEMDHGLYTPSGKWEMAKHCPIDGWETLMCIKGEMTGRNRFSCDVLFIRLVSVVTPPLSVILRKGVIAGNPITYISRLYVYCLRTSLSLWANRISQMEHE
jgi:hypothetical protein